MPVTKTATGSIRPCRFVKADGDHKVAEANANEKLYGISQEGGHDPPLDDLVTTNNAAESGDPILVFVEGDNPPLLELGGTVTAGDRLKSDADGKGVAVATSGTTAQEYGAVAQEGGASGEKIRVRPQFGVVRPAIA